MAIGDIVGDLATAYLTPEQRRAREMGVQSLTGGPISRASSKLPAAAGLAAVAPIGATASPAQSGSTQSLASVAPVGVFPTATSPTYPTTLQAQARLSDGLLQSTQVTPLGLQQPGSVAPTAQSSAPAVIATPTAQGLDDAYRPIGVGSGSSAIVARSGANGVPEFSNIPAAQQQAAGATPLMRNVATTSPDPVQSLASLGSASNIGDGVGTFSQSQPGDSQLALTRFQRANDLRTAYQAQDRADLANYRANQGESVGIVRDSSKPVTRSELAAAQLGQQNQVGLVQAADRAQKSVEDLRTSQAAATQSRQSQRLEDALSAATAPNATDEQKQRYQALIDPTGANRLKTQQAQAQLGNTLAEGQLKQQQFTKNTQTQQQAAQDKIQAQAGQAATFDQAIGSVDRLLGTEVDPKNPNGPKLNEDPGLSKSLGLFNASTPTLPGSDAADFQARLDTLKAQTFLPQVAALKGLGALSDAEGKKLSDSIGALSTKMSEKAFRQSLGEVRATLQSARERSAKANPVASAAGANPQPQVSGAPAVGAVQQGYVFLGGNPADQSSWRKQ